MLMPGFGVRFCHCPIPDVSSQNTVFRLMHNTASCFPSCVGGRIPALGNEELAVLSFPQRSSFMACTNIATGLTDTYPWRLYIVRFRTMVVANQKMININRGLIGVLSIDSTIHIK